MVAAMSGRYDQGDLNTYGAEDDEEMDMILESLERASRTGDGGDASSGTPEMQREERR